VHETNIINDKTTMNLNIPDVCSMWIIDSRDVTQEIPYKNKYWQGTKFGELANRHAIAKFKSCQYSISIVTLVVFE